MADQVLNHRGYIGSIEVSLEDNCLHGKLLFIRDLVTYEGTDPAKLTEEFHKAVENYLAHCKELGVQPDKTFSGTFNVRVAPELHKQACVRAVEQGVSLNEFVCNALRVATGEPLHIVNETHHHEHRHLHTVMVPAEPQQYDETAQSWQPSEKNQAKSAH